MAVVIVTVTILAYLLWPGPKGLELASISAGGDHSCGVSATGAAFCWGSNNLGQVGDGSTIDRGIPVPVAGAITFVSIDVGNSQQSQIQQEQQQQQQEQQQVQLAQHCLEMSDRGGKT